MKYELKIDRLFWGVSFIFFTITMALETFLIINTISGMFAIITLLKFVIGEKPHKFPNDDSACYAQIDIPINEKAKKEIQNLRSTSKGKVEVTITGLIDND